MASSVPSGWQRITSAVYYDDAAGAIEWLNRVFGFETRLKIPGEGNAIVHSELVYEGAVIMVGSPARDWLKSPKNTGGANTQNLMVYVGDVDAHCAKTRAAGARITVEPYESNYGIEYWTDRSYQAEDCEGHRWYFVQRIATHNCKY